MKKIISEKPDQSAKLCTSHSPEEWHIIGPGRQNEVRLLRNDHSSDEE